VVAFDHVREVTLARIRRADQAKPADLEGVASLPSGGAEPVAKRLRRQRLRCA
jgi:hypothetical protein